MIDVYNDGEMDNIYKRMSWITYISSQTRRYIQHKATYTKNKINKLIIISSHQHYFILLLLYLVVEHINIQSFNYISFHFLLYKLNQENSSTKQNNLYPRQREWSHALYKYKFLSKATGIRTHNNNF